MHTKRINLRKFNASLKQCYLAGREIALKDVREFTGDIKQDINLTFKEKRIIRRKKDV
jgi:hypothetical protein